MNSPWSKDNRILLSNTINLSMEPSPAVDGKIDQLNGRNSLSIPQLISCQAGPPNTFFGSLDRSAPNPEPG